MNYLAHSFLSGNNSGLLVGNFIADHLSGNDFSHLPHEVVEGIRLHRRIDVFTDSHPKFKESKRLFYNGFEKHSGILVDIYFDHLLAKNYAELSDTPLQEHCTSVYQIYKDHVHLMPPTSAGFLEYVLQNNIYHAYSTPEGIRKVLFHLSHRIKHGIKLDDSWELFERNENDLNNNFNAFMNDAIAEFKSNNL